MIRISIQLERLRAGLISSARAIREKRNLRRAIYIISLPPLLFFILNLALPLPAAKIEEDYSTVYMDRGGGVLRISLSPSEKYRLKLPLSGISRYIQDGIVNYEDKYFRYHPGVNPVSVANALIMNMRHGRKVSGASTISMQIARMIERKPRTYISKIIELFRALQLEFRYSKDELLEIYLNTIPMGGNLEGVGAGAYYYFGKDARDLSLLESALLIGVPNSPNRNRPDRFPQNAKAQCAKVLWQIYESAGLSEKDCRALLDRSLSVKAYPFPFRCPHLVESGRTGTNKFFVQYTVDLTLQTYCEKILKNYNQDTRGQGIFNGAVIVADNRTGEALAYVGSPDYFDDKHCGQVNGAAIPRSPGSALKPFLYAKAIEQGIITPEKIIYDIPIRDSEYSPVNYSKTSLGPVTAEYSLVHSLNIPAVRLEQLMAGKGLKGLLKEIFPGEDDIIIDNSGLSLVLGGFGLSLEQMAGLYMMMAGGGVYNRLKFHLREPDVGISPKRILDERSCFLISEMLTECYRPDLPHSWEFSPHHARAALKTGTSFGLRDAWCIAYNPDVTVGVWLGNADSSGSSRLIGVRMAAPLTIKIFNYITRDSGSWFKKPPGVAARQVCASSGEKPGRYCGSNLKKDYYIPGVSSENTCSVHRTITIRKKDGAEVCPYCMTGRPAEYAEKVIEYWPGEVISFLRRGGYKFTAVPPHNPECRRFHQSNSPKIISPKSESEFEIVRHIPADSQKIPLKAFVAQDADRVFWFLNSRFLYEAGADETCFLPPQRGEWTISAIDSKGRSDSVRIKIY